MDGYVKKVGVSSGYSSMNRHTNLQQNGLKSLMNYIDSNNMDINVTLQNGDVISGIGLLNRHTPHKDNDSSNFNDMNMGAKRFHVNGGYCYMNSSTGSE